MNQLQLTSHLRYEVSERTSFAFSIVAARTPHQTVSHEGIEIAGDVPWTLEPYDAGSHQLLRLTADPGELDISYTASVAVDARSAEPDELDEATFDDVPANVLPYLNPSRYCESDRLGGFAFRLFGETPAGFERVRAISDWVHANIVYEAGSTDGSSSATDVLLQRAGVCRDFAHVAITLCRAIGVPARYVSGYGVGVDPQDFHGFFEAYIGGDWYLFDPTGMTKANALARIGYGRDAADAPFATLVGHADLVDKSITVAHVDVPEAEPAAASTA
ncbi:MAG: transglutaminase family protein [Ilumatobacteraceae bacterium]